MDEIIHIQIDGKELEGMLNIPEGSKSIVIFAHGSGSSRLSPRNNYVASALNKAGISTLLFDLLTEDEDIIYENRFNIGLISKRLAIATKWVMKDPKCKSFKIGYFGASTGSAAALQASVIIGRGINSIVSRGGRPDLAEPYLGRVKSPTLLIVGGYDDVVIELNQKAYSKITSEKRLEIVPEATHLFEEPGKLEEVARLAKEWFLKHLR